jgi:hypothetical protein
MSICTVPVLGASPCQHVKHLNIAFNLQITNTPTVYYGMLVAGGCFAMLFKIRLF